MTTVATADFPLDWSQTTVDLHCPLCEYNLRGLIDPRCPECGFAFSWAELIDGQRNKHPYLFEHQNKRNLWSFWKTYRSDSFPRSFWRTLSPSQPVRLGRLIAFYLVSNALQFIWLLVLLGGAAYVRQAYWSMLSWNQLLNYLQNGVASRDYLPWCVPVLIALAWPALTLASLLVFQISMRRAKIRFRHVLRTVIYGCDFGAIVALPMFIALLNRPDDGGGVLVALVCGAVALYRITVAYHRYLRFHVPFWTVLTSQVIVFLAVLKFYLDTCVIW